MPPGLEPREHSAVDRGGRYWLRRDHGSGDTPVLVRENHLHALPTVSAYWKPDAARCANGRGHMPTFALVSADAAGHSLRIGGSDARLYWRYGAMYVPILVVRLYRAGVDKD